MSEIEEWKKEAGEIPEETCPQIDKCIKHLNWAQKWLRDIDAQLSKDIRWELEYCEDELEKIRKANSQLRDLGVFWYEKAKELAERLEKQMPVEQPISP